MTTGLVLFTRDLRLHDHPALAQAAATFDRVLPLFVFDTSLMRGTFASANRDRFLRQALTDLDASLGGRLVRRSADGLVQVVEEVLRAAREAQASAVWLSADVSSYARERQRRLAAACRDAGLDLRLFPGVTIVPPGDVHTSANGTFTVFSPFYRQWRQAPWRPIAPPATRLATVPSVASTEPPPVPGATSPELLVGGESAGRARMEEWLADGIVRYQERHDALAGPGTSRLSPYLHFGCVSPLELARRSVEAGGEAFVRQLCWRDFYCGMTAAVPGFAHRDFRHPRAYASDPPALRAWQDGRTGIPIVDAGMRQLRREGWMHNRARLLVGSFLTKNLRLDWRLGAAHFLSLLVDGDVANNAGNWQWVAGTGNDTRPNRVFNPTLQAQRYDPNGDYVRRFVPELASIPGGAIHEPWRLEPLLRLTIDYPAPIVDHAEAAARFRADRSAAARGVMASLSGPEADSLAPAP